MLIILYIILVTKSIYIAKTAKDNVGSYIAIGIAGIFFFHMLENIGMTMGLLPITGVPLMFVSYGGSAMITSFICIGLLLPNTLDQFPLKSLGFGIKYVSFNDSLSKAFFTLSDLNHGYVSFKFALVK